jgi:hypothetical protein
MHFYPITPDSISVFHIPIIRIIGCILITKVTNNIRQSIMLPANQNIARTSIPINNILDTARVIAITGNINRETKVLGQGFDSVVWALTFSTCMEKEKVD